MKTLNLGRFPLIAGALFALTLAPAPMALGQRPPDAEPGELQVIGRNGLPRLICPLKHTSVNSNISGFGARVHVVQTFTNPSESPIEAIYTFPLPHDAAVDRMRIKVGNRVIEGEIKRREEARRIYDAAKNAGQAAGLLDQERPNIFTQSVANIMPGATVQVDISFVQVLKYENGQFEYTFPMVVGPRYLGNAPDPQKISPPLTPEGTRTGTSIDLVVNLDAGAPIESLDSVLHRVSVNREDDRHATITLAKRNEIPNRDFILRYQTATNSIQSAFVTSYDAENGGFFDLILLPPKTPRPVDITPREMIFVVDKSGSQTGFPIQKSKELTYKLLNTMRPCDTFNVYSFNTGVEALWSRPRPYSAENLAEAHRFLDPMAAGGGTDILGVLRTVLTVPVDPERLRVVLFNTDGFVGDEPFILPEIKKDRGQTRIFAFGIGNSVNRYLIDAMSREGQGDSEVVTLAESADSAVEKFVQRLRTPVLTKVTARAEGLDVTEMVPQVVPDVFSDRPIIIQGRYQNPGHGKIVMSGRIGDRAWTQSLSLNFSADSGESCVPALWAHQKVEELTDLSYEQQIGQEGLSGVDFKSKIVDVALQFGIMSDYTSFVAVEPRTINVGGVSRTVHVPINMADGVTYTGIVGMQVGQSTLVSTMTSANTNSLAVATAAGAGGPGGFGGGAGFGGGRSLGKSAGPSFGGTVRENLAQNGPTALAHSFENVVDKRLRKLTGRVAVMVYLNRADAITIDKLKLLGLSVDENDSKLMLVIGTCDASAIKKIAEAVEVERITPVE
jgi:Ca-activated chloride channel family protein